MEYILIRPAVLDSRVTLWDRDEAHDGGDLVITGYSDKPVRVAATAGVLNAIAAGKLIQVYDVPEPIDPTAEIEGGDVETTEETKPTRKKAEKNE